VEGFMFDDTKLTDGPLRRQHLDAVTKDHPVAVHHRGGHTSWYNTRAFALAKITSETPDPSNGRFFRDSTGELTGQVAQLARDVFDGVGSREKFTPAQQRDRNRAGMAHISKLLTAAGLTSVHDAMTFDGKIHAYEDARAAGELRHRAYMMMRTPYRRLRDAG